MKIFIVAGEASGDLHAANLLEALRPQSPGLEASGVGGERLRAAGLDCVAGSEELSVMGLAEVVKHLPRLWRLSRLVKRAAVAAGPAVAVLVDSPDFNLPLARVLRSRGIPVVVYVSPQVWAWRRGRVRRIRRDVRRVLCILPFETAFYEAHGVAAEYVGHPLVDELAPIAAEPRERANVLALMPGSRRHEVATLLPAMAEAARRLQARDPGLAVKLIGAPGLDPAWISSLLGALSGSISMVTSERHRVLRSCRAALVASGTATLECALLDVPMVVGYRLAPLSYFLARRLVHVPPVALVNLVAGRRVVEELVQDDFTADRLVAAVEPLLGAAWDDVRRGLAEVRALLGGPGASERAARAVLRVAGGEV